MDAFAMDEAEKEGREDPGAEWHTRQTALKSALRKGRNEDLSPDEVHALFAVTRRKLKH